MEEPVVVDCVEGFREVYDSYVYLFLSYSILIYFMEEPVVVNCVEGFKEV